MVVSLVVAALGVGMAVPAAGAAPSCRGVRAIGDSVMLGAAGTLRGKGITVDAVESRSFRSGARLAAAAVGSTAVVLHLGTNGPMRQADFDGALGRLRRSRVVLVTIQLPPAKRYTYEAGVNAMLRGAARRYRNVRLVDWNTVTNGNPALLARDGIHLNGAGPRRYAALVVAAACT